MKARLRRILTHRATWVAIVLIAYAAWVRLGPLPPNHHADYLAPFQLDTALHPARTRQNQHLQDRAAMRAGSWSGIVGVRSQDHAVAESMGPIVDRTREHLGASDVAVIRMRRRLLDAVHIDRLNLGPVPTTQLNWRQPHEGNIVEFLFRARAYQSAPIGA